MSLKKEKIQEIQEQIQETLPFAILIADLRPEVELLENMFNDILNDNDLPILADDLQDDVTLMATIGVLPPKFIVKEN